MKNIGIRNNENGVALLFTLLLTATILSFMCLSFFLFVSNQNQKNYYVNQLQEFYTLEAAQNAVMWEETNADVPMAWSTANGTATVCKLQGGSVGIDNFYRLTDYNFRSRVINTGSISILSHAFKGTEAEPKYSEYAEYIYAPNSPLYQYVLFINGNLTFPYTKAGGTMYLFHCNGGKIHANGDITFAGQTIRFDQIKELSGSGTMKYYSQGYPYGSPSYFDSLDGQLDGMAPAPYQTSDPPESGDYQAYTTDGVNVLPGPFKYWSNNNPEFKSLADRLAGASIWYGEENFFYGRQYIDAIEPKADRYISVDGEDIGSSPPSNAATVHRFYLSDLAGGALTEATIKGVRNYASADVYFRPYADSEGNLNNEWFELPGALPETYSWPNKYYPGKLAAKDELPISLYATESCPKGSAGCQFTENPKDAVYATGWRYIKSNIGGACSDDGCYNDPASNYTKAQDYVSPDGKIYFDSSHITAPSYNKNYEFLEDYIYASDINDIDSPYRKVRAFDAKMQPNGFQAYENLLANYDMEDVIQPNIPRKEISLGRLFDDASGDSPYKAKAKQSGIYIDSSNVDSVISDLNSGGQEVAKKSTFYNWETTLPITLVDIDMGKLNAAGKAPANGIVYVKGIPVRLSNAATLPGVNSADGKKAVFTVISEESVYLKGDYNYDPKDPDDEGEKWKVSNIATKKKVYTLSNAFDDAAAVPDLAVYNNYPYVYVKKDANGVCLKEEGDPALNNGAWVPKGASSSSGIAIPSAVRTWIDTTVDGKQTDYAKQDLHIPNAVDKARYDYNSLFITPYEIDDSLESWVIDGYSKIIKQLEQYLSGSELEFFKKWYSKYKSLLTVQAEKHTSGSILDLYAEDAEHPEYLNYKAVLGPEEAGDQAGSSSRPGLNTRGRLAPKASYLYINGAGLNVLGTNAPTRYFNYDPRFPSTITNNPDATLGVTGGSGTAVNIWRPIRADYFKSQTSN